MADRLSPAETWFAYVIVCLAVVGAWTVWSAVMRAAYRVLPVTWQGRVDAARAWLEAPRMDVFDDDEDDEGEGDGLGWGSATSGEGLRDRAYLAFIDPTWDEDLTRGDPR